MHSKTVRNEKKVIKSTLACVKAINVEHAFNKWLLLLPLMCMSFWLRNDVWVWIFYLFLHLYNFFVCWLNAVFTIADSHLCTFQRASMISHVYRARKRFFPICWHTYELKVAAENKAISVNSSPSAEFHMQIKRLLLQIHAIDFICFSIKWTVFWLKSPTSHSWHANQWNSIWTEMLI